jgi:A/G-specific adenine glycosylase
MPDFTTLIQNWYRLNKRELPWRSEISPYKTWISEIILQQTQVIQGLDYYNKFIDEFPTVFDLANSTENNVLRLWQGLGYYSRARNLHFAAKQIVNEFDGIFPTTYKDIIQLKGVGEYTASAISSIAYNLPHAAVDGNVFRVLSRVFEINSPINSTKGKKEFSELANQLLDINHPGNHNQALMEIGALICKPKNPNCLICPLQSLCLSLKNKSFLNYPIKLKKTKSKKITLNYLVITNGTHIIIKQRGDKDIWQGLYDFPIEVDNPKNLKLDLEIKHILTHRIIQAKFWLVDFENYTPNGIEKLVRLSELENYPKPQLLVKYFKQSNYFK